MWPHVFARHQRIFFLSHIHIRILSATTTLKDKPTWTTWYSDTCEHREKCYLITCELTSKNIRFILQKLLNSSNAVGDKFLQLSARKVGDCLCKTLTWSDLISHWLTVTHTFPYGSTSFYVALTQPHRFHLPTQLPIKLILTHVIYYGWVRLICGKHNGTGTLKESLVQASQGLATPGSLGFKGD